MRRIREEEQLCPVCGWQHGRTNADFPDALPPGTSLHDGRYLAGRVLGSGGFGITYIGIDRLLNLRVAIKEYFPSKQASRDSGTTSLRWQGSESDRLKGRESFVKEARNMARINEIPGIVRVRDIFYQNQTAYIVMDYIEGETLRDRLHREGLMDEAACRRIFFPLMHSLSEAHRRGLIHRDISPDNIMIEGEDEAERIWLLDMGAAREHRESAAGSGGEEATSLIVRHGFSPPEQYSDPGETGPWTDVYALAACIYYCLTGRVVPNAVRRLKDDSLEFSDRVPGYLQDILRRALSVSPADRYQSVDALQEDWEAVTAGETPAADVSGPGYAGHTGDAGSGSQDAGKGRKKTAARRLLPLLAAVLSAAAFLAAFFLFRSAKGGEDLHVEELGAGNANIANGGICTAVGDDRLFYVSGDSVLYESRMDADSGTFFLNDAEKADVQATFLVTDGENLYYIAEHETGKRAVCRLEPDKAPEELAVYRTDGLVRDLQYARLSDGSEYLWYLVGEEGPNSISGYVLHRRSLAEGTDEEILDRQICWYNLYGEYIYYTYEADAGGFVLCRKKLDGGEAEVLNDTRNLYGGFIEDDLLFLYSVRDETVLVYQPDGTPNEAFSGFYQVDIDMSCSLGYGDGWLYYTGRSDGGIHRIRTNGTGDTLMAGEHRGMLVCAEKSSLFFMERRQRQERQYVQQLYVAGKNADAAFAVQDPFMYWDLPDIAADELLYDVSETDGAVTITGCRTDAVSFRIPSEIDGRPVKKIGDNAFADSPLQAVGLPEGLEEIGTDAFRGSKSLVFAGLPDSLLVIGQFAFGECGALTGIRLPDGLQTIGNYAFAETALSEVSIPASAEDIGAGAFAVNAGTGFTAFTVDAANNVFFAKEGILYRTGVSAEGEQTVTLWQCPSSVSGTVSIPDGVTAVADFAFAHCTRVEALQVPDTVLSVGYGAFLGCGITEITVSALCQVNSATGADIEIHYRTQ